MMDDHVPLEVVTEYSHSDDSGSSSDCSDDIFLPSHAAEAMVAPLGLHDFDESELGEFLMDTFEGVEDAMAFMDGMPELNV
jgi:hypothetical protein